MEHMTTIGTPNTTEDGNRFTPKEHLGKLVMFCGHDKTTIETEFGEAIVATVSLVAVLDGDEVEIYNDAFIFGKALAPSIYRSTLDVVVGVISQGYAKAGKQAPWTLSDPTEVQLTAAREWFPKHVVESGGEYMYKPDQAPF